MLRKAFNASTQAAPSVRRALALVGVLALAPASAQAGEGEDAWLRLLGHLNAVGLAEPAGSHGSLGLSLGMGATAHRVDAPEEALAAEAFSHTPGSSPFVVPRMWLVKGLPWPVDVGFSAATAMDGAFTQASGYLQWTLHEALGRPALSLRASHGRLYGLRQTSLASSGMGVVVSQGLVRYLTLFGAYEAQLHEATLGPGDDGGPDGLEQEGGEAERRRLVSSEGLAGLRLMVHPPFVAVTAEASLGAGRPRRVAAKVSVGL